VLSGLQGDTFTRPWKLIKNMIDLGYRLKSCFCGTAVYLPIARCTANIDYKYYCISIENGVK